MPITPDQRFAFDVQGFLHLRGAMSGRELSRYVRWMKEAETTDVNALNDDGADNLRHQLNRPVSRFLDADPRFLELLDHPAVEPFLREFLGRGYRHIDNDLYYTYPGYTGGGWHRGVRPHPTGHVVGGRFICPMVKVFYCVTGVGRGGGEFAVVPGSHRAQLEIETRGRVDLPGQHVFGDVSAGDVVVFNEGLLHTGRPNTTPRTRRTLIINFGRRDAGVWPGYAPRRETLRAASPRQRRILSNGRRVWAEPKLA